MPWILLAAGAGAFVAAHSVAILAWPKLAGSQPVLDNWWLNAASSVAVVSGIVAAVSWAVLRSSSTPLWLAAATWGGGLMLGMTVVLFSIGPGTIWPLVLVMGGTLLAVSVGAAAGVVLLTRRGP